MDLQANFPNLRRLFIEARSDDEEKRFRERLYVAFISVLTEEGFGYKLTSQQFYNAVLFMGSVAVFSLIAQRMNASR